MGHGLEMNQILKFGPFEVDLAVRQLTQSGQPVPLTPKVFQTLEILVRNRDRVVSKRELLTTIWPECHVEEANLTQNISVLRKALGETSCPTKYIVTFPRQGYRFIGELAPEIDLAEAAVETAAVPPRPARRSQLRYLWAAGLLLPITVLGVSRLMRTDPPPQFFLLFTQQPEVGAMSYEIRTAMKPESILPALRQVAQQIAPDLPLANVRTQDQQIEAAMQQERVFVTLTSGFGVLALALASVGVYGIMAYSVAQRTNEIGIRLALGALPSQVRGMILGESTWLAGVGVAAGAAAALVLCRLLRSMLYGIRPDDPATMVGGVAILLAVALAASWIPARRAAGVEPFEALRHE